MSRQPDAIRLPSQAEEADNLTLSIVSGGIEKRDPTQYLTTVSGAAADDQWAVHPVDRDETERYLLMVSADGSLRVFDGFDGSEKTVTLDAGKATELAAYLTTGAVHPQRGLAFVTQVDVTVIVNRNVDTAMLPAPDPAPTLAGSVENTGGLPGSPSDGDVYEITGGPSELDNYFVKWVAADSRWIETVDPRIANSFDPDTMPIKVTRQSDGTFLVEQIAWDSRAVGSEATVPAPQFIGNPIRDVFFYKNRLGFLSDTNVYYSQAGDYFNLWPDKATDVLDSDPIDIGVPSSKVSILQWGLTFRKTLFLTSDKAQFEQTNTGLLTPRTASIDETTVFSTPNLCKPVTMGSELYFASEVSGNGVVYEYYYDDRTISNTADNVAKHVLGYVPGSIRRMAGDPTSDTLFVLAGDPTSDIYVYNVYWNGTEKVQSAWSRWTVAGDVLDMAAVNDDLYLLVRRGTETMLLYVRPSDVDTDSGFRMRLDQKVYLTGVYDAGSKTTTWTVPYAHHDAAKVVLSTGFVNIGRSLNATYSGTYDIVAPGDWSGGTAVVGFTYRSRYRFSRLFARGQDNKAYLQGRAQAKRMKMRFEDTGYFEVHVMPSQRDSRVYVFTGRQVSVVNNIIGKVALSSGDFSFGLNGRSDSTVVEIVSESYLPFTITSASWTGFYNSTTRSR